MHTTSLELEAGKKAAASLLSLQTKVIATLEQQQPISLVELADRMGERARIESIYQIVRHLAAKPSHSGT